MQIITPDTPAFNDGRLKMGDRLLQVCGCGVCVGVGFVSVGAIFLVRWYICLYYIPLQLMAFLQLHWHFFYIINFRYLLVPANNCDTKSVVVCSVSVHVLVLCVTKQRVEVFTVPTPHQVNGRPVTGLTQSEVVSLLRQAQGDVTLVVSRHEVVDEQDTEEVRPHPLKSCDL